MTDLITSLKNRLQDSQLEITYQEIEENYISTIQNDYSLIMI